MPRTQPRVFLSMHPHQEPKYPKVAIGSRITIPWNTSSKHKRKLIQRSGKYLSDDKEVTADLFFFGEYEPKTEAVLLSTTFPKAVHDKLYPVRGRVIIPPNANNTDPYVFGNHFKNICCQIGRRKYIPGDMILFGKLTPNEKKYALDTVIIIKGTVKIDTKRTRSQYYNAAIKPMRHRKHDFFYIGENYASGKQYYSYVPCHLNSSDCNMPLVDILGLGFVVKHWGRTPVAASIPFTYKIWEEIKKQVIDDGCLIGTHIDTI